MDNQKKEEIGRIKKCILLSTSPVLRGWCCCSIFSTSYKNSIYFSNVSLARLLPSAARGGAAAGVTCAFTVRVLLLGPADGQLAVEVLLPVLCKPHVPSVVLQGAGGEIGIEPWGRRRGERWSLAQTAAWRTNTLFISFLTSSTFAPPASGDEWGNTEICCVLYLTTLILQVSYSAANCEVQS